ncbi:hypothetical protein HDE_00254 [Halotydeus destructor]|nr:hypothetical protein HDE_00254 [Halotydeus destructor]
METVFLSLWLLALTNPSDGQAVHAECASEAGPDALRLTKGLSLVYKDGNVHQLMEQLLDRLPIIHSTYILTRLPFPSDHKISAVLDTEKPTYYCNTGNSKQSVVCDETNCRPLELSNEPIAVTHVSAAAIAGDNIFLAFMDDKENEYQAIVNARNYVLHIKKLGNKMADGRKQNPTVVKVLSRLNDTNDYKCLVFFGPIYGFHAEDLSSLTRPVVLRKTIDYQLSNTWLGCDPVVCFDARMDFAYHDQGSIVMGRGYSRWRIDLDKKTDPHILKREALVADDIIKQTNFKVVFQETFTTFTNSTPTKVKTRRLFPKTKLPIEAAFSLNISQFYLISNQRVDIYKQLNCLVSSNSYHFRYFYSLPLSAMFNMFEKTIDAAVSVDNGTIFLFRNNHYYSHNFDTNITSAPMLIQNNLFTCSDSFYSSSKASEVLNIMNFEQFEQYRMQFAERNTTTLATSSKPIASKSTTVLRQRNTLFLVTLVVLIVSALICISAIISLKVYLKNMRPSSEDMADIPLPDGSVTSGSVSTEMKVQL